MKGFDNKHYFDTDFYHIYIYVYQQLCYVRFIPPFACILQLCLILLYNFKNNMAKCYHIAWTFKTFVLMYSSLCEINVIRK